MVIKGLNDKWSVGTEDFVIEYSRLNPFEDPFQSDVMYTYAVNTYGVANPGIN